MADSEMMSPADESTVRFDFRHGWCALTLGARDEKRTFTASSLVDCFGSLLRTIRLLLEGGNCASAIWGGEGSGAFVDLSLNWRGELAIVVHEMADPNYLEPGRGWLPVRARTLASYVFDIAPFSRALAHELRRVETSYSDGSGYMPHWGWRFPRSEYDRIEAHAMRHGYRPEPLDEEGR